MITFWWHSVMSSATTQQAGYRLAESTAEIHAAELLLCDAAARLDQLGEVENVDPVLNASIIRDCGFGVKTLAKAVDRLYEASGANAMRADEPIQRLWRDVNAARSHAILTWITPRICTVGRFLTRFNEPGWVTLRSRMRASDCSATSLLVPIVAPTKMSLSRPRASRVLTLSIQTSGFPTIA